MERGVIQGKHGAPLAYLKYPHQGTNRGLIHICHGMAEHKERYHPLMEYLASLGFTVYAHDHRRHGESLAEGEAVGIFLKEDTFETIVDDIDIIQQTILKKEKQGSLILIGHSMGSMLARRYLMRQPSHVSRALILGTVPKGSAIVSFLTASFITLVSYLKPSHKRHFFIQGLMNKALKKEPKGHRFGWLSYNEENVTRYTDDPLSGYAYNGLFYRRFFWFLHQFNKKHPPYPMIPTFFISGSDDPVSVNEAALQKTLMLQLKQQPEWPVRLSMIEIAEHEWFRKKNPHNELFKEVLNDAL